MVVSEDAVPKCSDGIPLEWENTAAISWASWKHVLPYLSLGDINSLARAGDTFKIIVDLFLASGKVILENAFLRQYPPADHLAFYKYIGRLATRLAVLDTVEQDLEILLSCFPHLRELTLRRVLIPHREIKEFPVKLHKLTIEQCEGDRDFLKTWSAALAQTLVTLHLKDVGTKFVGTLGCNVKHLRVAEMPSSLKIVNDGLETLSLEGANLVKELSLPFLKKLKIVSQKNTSKDCKINCPALEDFSLDVPFTENNLLEATLGGLKHSAKTLTTLALKNWPQKEIGILGNLSNLKHLTIVDPIKDTANWDILKRFRAQLETFKCDFLSAPLDTLLDEILMEIIGYLNTEDVIALTQVNRRFRRIVFDHVYPATEMKLITDFKRYPLKDCGEIYKAFSQRVRKLRVSAPKCQLFDGGMINLTGLKFPNLKSFRIDSYDWTGIEGVPADLESLRLWACEPNDEVNLLLYKVAANLQDFYVSLLIEISLPLMPNLQKLKAKMTPSRLTDILQNTPNLHTLDVDVDDDDTDDKSERTMNNLIEALAAVPKLTDLSLSFCYWRRLSFNIASPLAEPILPKLKELKIRLNVDQSSCAGYFLRNICHSNLKKLVINFYFDEIKAMQGLESLTISKGLEIKTLIALLEELPLLKEFYGHKSVPWADRMELIAFLVSNEREISYNNVNLGSYSDLFGMKD